MDDGNKVINADVEENVGTMLPVIGLNGENSINEDEISEEEIIESVIPFMESEEYDLFIQESLVAEEKDIFYNQIKYENGETNLLFITGYSGGGKSTMSKSEEKFLREVVDMDRIVLFTNKPDDYYTKLGNFAKEFMINGPGKKYREEKDVTLKNALDSFRRKISKDLVHFAKSYAKENKRKKLIMEGVWIYRYIEPSEIEEFAVYIKGTSLKTSTERAIKRDTENMKKDKKSNPLKRGAHSFAKVVMASKDVLLRNLEKHQKYFADKYEKQKNDKIKMSKVIKNETKGIIHDLAGAVKKYTESEDIVMNELYCNEYIKEYMNNPEAPYDEFVQEGVKDIANKIKERVVVSKDTCKLVVDIYILKKKIKKATKTGDTKREIDLKRELVRKQMEMNAVKKSASPELQKEITKIEKNLEKQTKKFDIEDIKTESVEDKVFDESVDAIEYTLDYVAYDRIRENEKKFINEFKTVMKDYKESYKRLNKALGKADQKEIKSCIKEARNKLKKLESTVNSAPRLTEKTVSLTGKVIKSGLAAIATTAAVGVAAYGVTKANQEKKIKDAVNSQRDWEEGIDKIISDEKYWKDYEDKLREDKKMGMTANRVVNTYKAVSVAGGLAGLAAKHSVDKARAERGYTFKDYSNKFKSDQMKFIEKNRKYLDKIENMNLSVKKEYEENIEEGIEIMESLCILDISLEDEVIIEKEDDKVTLPPELKRLDEIRGKIEELGDDLEIAKKKLNETGEKIYENKVKGLTAKLDKLKKELSEKEKEAEKIQEKNKKDEEVKESVYEVIVEAANMEDEIKPIVDKLNEKGYKVKYASPGHKNLRKKEDKEPDGIYYSKLYSDARVMFADKYSFGDAPKYWHWRDVEGCSYLDITPLRYDKKDGSQDEAFTKWKENYMNSLKTFVDGLKKNGEEVKESVDEFANSFIENVFESMGINDLENYEGLVVNESVVVENSTENLLKELDELLK